MYDYFSIFISSPFCFVIAFLWPYFEISCSWYPFNSKVNIYIFMFFFFFFLLCGFENEFYVNIFLKYYLLNFTALSFSPYFWDHTNKMKDYVSQFSKFSYACLCVYKFNNFCASLEHIWCKWTLLFHCSNSQRFRSTHWTVMTFNICAEFCVEVRWKSW
jgi:hypothetical protein